MKLALVCLLALFLSGSARADDTEPQTVAVSVVEMAQLRATYIAMQARIAELEDQRRRLIAAAIVCHSTWSGASLEASMFGGGQ